MRATSSAASALGALAPAGDPTASMAARAAARNGVQLRTRVLQRSEEQDLQAAGPCKRGSARVAPPWEWVGGADGARRAALGGWVGRAEPTHPSAPSSDEAVRKGPSPGETGLGGNARHPPRLPPLAAKPRPRVQRGHVHAQSCSPASEHELRRDVTRCATLPPTPSSAARTLEARASPRKDAHTTYAQARSTLDI